VGEASSKRLAEGRQQVEMAKLGEQARQEDITSQRAFQSGEALKGRDFAGEQSQLGRDFAGSQGQLTRDFQAGESQKGRLFAGEQGQLTRDFAGSQSQLTRDFQGSQSQLTRDFAGEQGDLTRGLQQQGIDLQQEEFAINKLVSLFNMGGDSAKNVRDYLASILGVGMPTQTQVGITNSSEGQPSVLAGTTYG
jgi:hypothetical protein